MKITENINKEQLNDFIARQEQAQFLQSWEWGELMAQEGKRAIRLGFFDDEDRMFFAISIFKNKLPLGWSYLYAPRINLDGLDAAQAAFVWMEIKKIAQKEKALFLRLEPMQALESKIKDLKIEKTLDLQPKKTLLLDLGKTEAELLAAMHQKTRYNINLSERKGVVIRTIEKQNLESGFAEFWRLMRETGGRDDFRIHDREHYRRMLDIPEAVSANQLSIKLLSAEYEGKMIAGGIFAFFGDLATYVHGASANEGRNVMAPYLLQWTAVKMARAAGCKHYDFYGIDEKKWPGVTRFKMGFGGETLDYPGTFDVIIRSLGYALYDGLRKWRRRF